MRLSPLLHVNTGIAAQSYKRPEGIGGTDMRAGARDAAVALSRIDSNAVPWLAYPLIPNSFFKILQVDEDSNTVILRYKMGANVVTPLHAHHCVATAFTLDGVWYYDDLEFRAGDIAFERDLEPHQPYTREQGAELLTTFIGGRGNDVLLEEFTAGGGSYLLRTRFFKALCGITAAELGRTDLTKLLE